MSITSMKSERSISSTTFTNEQINVATEKVSNLNVSEIISTFVHKRSFENLRFSFKENTNIFLGILTPHLLIKTFSFFICFLWVLMIILTIF